MNNLTAESINHDILLQFNIINETIKDLSKFLCENAEESFKEYKSMHYITNILKKFDFNVNEGYMDYPTSFIAVKGNGHPKICFLCEYDGDTENGHITGNNLSCAASVAAALSLGSIINNIEGTITLIGCPGQLKCSCNNIFVKQGAFNDIDAAFIIRPYTYTGYINSCDAHLPVKVTFECNNSSKAFKFSPSDACMLALNSICTLSKGLNDSSIDNISYEKNTITFEIKAKDIKMAEEINNNIKIIIKAIASSMGLIENTTLLTMPCHEFINNSTLLRLFAHNLKQNGIIEISEFSSEENITNCGCISSAVPCISPFISIICDKNTKYKTLDFARCAESDHAFSIMMNAAKALSFTACDILQKKTLLEEAILHLKTPKHLV